MSLIDDARSGRGGMVLVEGAPGTGKSALLAAAAGRAEASGFQHLAGAGDESGRLVPFSALLPVLEGTVLASLTEPGASADVRLCLLEEMRVLLEERAARGSVLLTIDDVQWADPTSAFALRALPSQLASHPIAWLLARRTGSGMNWTETFRSLLASDLVDRVELGPLRDDAVVELMRDLLGVDPAPELVAAAAAAGGNPLLVTELIRGLRDERALDVRGAVAGLAAQVLPHRVQTVVEQRLLTLETPTRQLLGVAAVLGTSFAVDDVAELLGELPGRLLPALQEALAAGVLVESGGAMSFRQSLVWQAVVETVPLSARTALHRQAGAMLLARGAPAASAARHLLAGTRRGDRRGLDALDRAARETLRVAPPTAVELAQRALELTADADANRFARAVTAVDALMADRRLSEAAALARSTLARSPELVAAARLRCSLARILIHDGRPDEAVAEAETVLARGGLPAEVVAEAELERLVARLTAGDLGQVQALSDVVLADPGTRPALGVAARQGLAQACWEDGRVSAAFTHAGEAVQLADASPAESHRTHPRLHLAAMLQALARLDEADAVIAAAGAEIERHGDTVFAAAPPLLRARSHLAAGRLDDALLEAQSGQSIAEELGTRLYVPEALAVLAAVELRRGHLREAEQYADRSRAASAGRSTVSDLRRLFWLEPQLAAARGDRGEAADLLVGAYANPSAHTWLFVQQPAAGAWMARLAAAIGRVESAEPVVAHTEELAAENPDFPAVVAASIHARGVVDHDLEALRTAAAGQPDRWAAASADEDFAALAGDDGAHHDEAVAGLERALAVYEGVGAARDIARIRHRLRRLGVRHAHARRPNRPATGWVSLTESESAVVDLVAQGLTDRQVAAQLYVSAHTVNSHLRAVFRKLSINSRVELAAMVAARLAGGAPGAHLAPRC